MSPSASGSKEVLGSRSPWTCPTHPWRFSAVFFTDDLLDHSAEQTNLLTLLFCRFVVCIRIEMSVPVPARQQGTHLVSRRAPGRTVTTYPHPAVLRLKETRQVSFICCRHTGRMQQGQLSVKIKGDVDYYNSKTGLLALQ